MESRERENETDRVVSRKAKRRRRQKTRPIAVIVLIAVAAAIVVCVLVLGSVSKDMSQKENFPNAPENNDASSLTDGEDDADEVVMPPDGDAEVDVNTVDGKPYYYDSAREDRYIAFATNHPEIAGDDVYWMVDCDLDTLPYEDTHELPDPDDILLMVNKHFYLPEGFAPVDLVNVGNTTMRAEAGEAMQEMIDAAAAEGLNIWSQSGYRSYGVQVNLYRDYSARDGEAAADTYSARPGYSEHQTGLTTDLNTITDAFGDTPEGQWVAANCWQYGYIVRYTKENTDVTLYKPEPWHMRYIGRDAAETMHDEGILSLEEYWVKYVLYQPPGVG
ncbi:MAG: M15 family metallopeptidase [Clostridiales Family XIII bacterium]|jgi:D-alanyl-D-alanine carboxypeptidase|nr:M15 family metallopeptidase [Clostridiales Family XIII bacterium]